MGVIKRADAETHARDAIALDLADVQRRADAVVGAAQHEAREILARACDESDAIRARALEESRREGYERGLTEGRGAGADEGRIAAQGEMRERLDALETAWSAALGSWEHDRRDLMLAAKGELVELAASIAARVLKRSVDLDPEVVVDQLDAVLETLVSPTDLRVRAHPDDIELLGRVAPAMFERCAQCTHATIVPDPSLTRGSCVAHTGRGGTIDASIGAQLDRIAATLVPSHTNGAYDAVLDPDEDAGMLGTESRDAETRDGQAGDDQAGDGQPGEDAA